MKEATVTATELEAVVRKSSTTLRQRGETIVVTRRGKPMAQLAPIAPDHHALKGRWRGLAKPWLTSLSFETSGEWHALR